MTKRDLAKELAKRTNLTVEKTLEVLNGFLDLVVETTEQEGKLELRNFGVFEVRDTKERTARNPKTNESISVPAKRVLRFKAGKNVKTKLNTD